MVKTFSIFCFAVFLVACSGANKKDSVIKVTSIVAVGNDGESGEFCAAFSLTKDEAQYFFDNAIQISARETHDNYSFLPCFVTGEGYLNKKKV